VVKFDRNYILSIETQNGEILVIQPPFTIEFDITRNILSSANVCQIRIYNLSANNRNKIRFDRQDSYDFRSVQLQAGYGNNLPVIFSGSITQAWSVREGVNFITSIECFDGGFAFANGITNTVFPAQTPITTVINNLVGNLPRVAVGAVGNYSGVLSRGRSFSGNTSEILRDLTGGGFFIDNGRAHCLGDSECLEGEMVLINSQSGLLGTPVRELTVLNFDMIFEPRLIVGQAIQIDSKTGMSLNQFYKVISVKHRGMISESICGNAVTSVGVWYGTQALQIVPVPTA
jgi:hypothetical protein